MREASFLLPREIRVQENWQTHRWVVEQLENAFSGWSADDLVRGGWKDDYGTLHRDILTRYTVAYPVEDWLSCEKHMEVVRFIAVTAGRQAGQQAVYIKDHDGNVEVVTC